MSTFIYHNKLIIKVVSKPLLGLTTLNQALICTPTPNLMGVIQSESMISQAFQACYLVEGCLSDHCILSLDQVESIESSLLNNPTTSLRTQKSAIRWLLSPWDGSRCQDSIDFLSGSLSVILKVQTDETQLKINKKGNSFFFQPLLLLSFMTDVTFLSSMPTGHSHMLLLHFHTSLLPNIL